jgi:hypothetical protein
MNYQSLNINQKINFKMANLIAHYLLTKHSSLRKIVPRNCKTKARYGTCYDLVSPAVPLEEVNKFISEASGRVKDYIKNNRDTNKYLKVEMMGTPYGVRITHGLINELPKDYKDLERIGVARFVETKDLVI